MAYYPSSASGLAYYQHPSNGIVGLSVTASASANAKGSYSEMVASTAGATNWLSLTITSTNITSSQGMLVDIATGAAASEVVLIPDLPTEGNSFGSLCPAGRYGPWPVDIAGSTRIALRCQSATAGGEVLNHAFIHHWAAGTTVGATGYTAYGVDTSASIGEAVDPGGTPNTKGSYIELEASTGIVIQLLSVQSVASNSSPGNPSAWRVDIATGAGGAEVVLIPDLVRTRSEQHRSIFPKCNTFPTYIASSTRLSFRASCNTADVQDRNFELCLLGATGSADTFYPQSATGLAAITYPVGPTAVTEFLPEGSGNNVKGAYEELVASSPFTCNWTEVNHTRVGSGQARVLIDVAIGAAAAEAVIVPNLISESLGTGSEEDGGRFSLPLAIASGTRIAMRQQSSTAAREAETAITLIAAGSENTPASYLTYGADTADSGGTEVDPGAVQFAKGAYSELTSGTGGVGQQIVVEMTSQSNAAGIISTRWSVDIATGAAASEVVLLPDVAVGVDSGDEFFQERSHSFQVYIPTSTRLAARAASNNTTSGDRLIDVAVALAGAGTSYAQEVTQLVLEVLIDEEADDPPAVTACSGSGTVASGTNPSAGTSLATATTPLAWIEVVVDGTTHRFAGTAINDATPKAPRVKSFGRCARGLSDGDGRFESPSMTVRLIDHDRLLRGWIETEVLINAAFSAWVSDLTTIQAAGAPWREFVGLVQSFEAVSELEFELHAEGRFSVSATAANLKVPARVVTSSISDSNPIERVNGMPVAIILGACSDENEDDPRGVVPAFYIASETPEDYDDNLHKFLVCGHALKNIQAIYLANYVSGGDEPTTRIAAPESAYGTILWSPHQPGWFSAGEYTDQNDERYTYVYGLDAHLAVELARSGRIPLLLNVCGLESTGDATGTMLSNPARCFALVLNNRLAQEATANWLSQLSLGSYTLLDMTSFEAVATICAARSYLCAGIIGADGEQLDWAELGEVFCRNFDFDWGENRHGQIILSMLDRTSAYSSATIFTDQNHVLKNSLRIRPMTDRVQNEIQFVYKRNYAEALHALVPNVGARPNRDPYDGKWFSGLQTDPDETVITEMGGRPLGLRQSRVQEYGLIRDTDTAEDVARQRREWWKRPRAEVSFTVPLGAGAGVELGEVIKLTHFAGATATGYTTRRLQVRRIEDDLDDMTRTFTTWDVHNLLA